MKKLPNPRRVKIHRNYTVEESALICNVHKNTVRSWIKNGLATVDRIRPILILGKDLRAFLEAKRAKNKHKLQSGEIYCVRCRVGIRPLDDFAELQSFGDIGWSLVGFCPHCECEVFRRIGMARISQAIGDLEVAIPKALEQLVNGSDPSLNSDFNQGVLRNAKTQS